MSTVQEIEAAIPRLKRDEIEALRAWIDDYLEDQLELTVEVKQRLDQMGTRVVVQGHAAAIPSAHGCFNRKNFGPLPISSVTTF